MWREIKNYEGIYEVNEDGQIKSLDREITDSRGVLRRVKGRDMKLTKASGRDDADGYLVVNLRSNGTSCVIPVHRLVAEAFLPNPDRLPTVNHKDGNKCNNNVGNLEWASYSDNNVHALVCGLRKPRGNRVGQYDGHDLISSFASACEASRKTGISRGMISHCLNGRCKSAGGYVWQKLSEGQTTIPLGSTQEDELPAEAQGPHVYAEDIVCPASNGG